MKGRRPGDSIRPLPGRHPYGQNRFPIHGRRRILFQNLGPFQIRGRNRNPGRPRAMPCLLRDCRTRDRLRSWVLLPKDLFHQNLAYPTPPFFLLAATWILGGSIVDSCPSRHIRLPDEHRITNGPLFGDPEANPHGLALLLWISGGNLGRLPCRPRVPVLDLQHP
jgi:hypothetical protein